MVARRSLACTPQALLQRACIPRRARHRHACHGVGDAADGRIGGRATRRSSGGGRHHRRRGSWRNVAATAAVLAVVVFGCARHPPPPPAAGCCAASGGWPRLRRRAVPRRVGVRPCPRCHVGGLRRGQHRRVASPVDSVGPPDGRSRPLITRPDVRAPFPERPSLAGLRAARPRRQCARTTKHRNGCRGAAIKRGSGQ